MSVRVRFAPSPTGYLHVGGLRTALYNYLFARHLGGKCILRIEDTDRTRLVENAAEKLIESLKWAGVEFDEGPIQGGDCGPYTQSERLGLYKKYADILLATGSAYYAFDTSEEIAAMRERQQAENLDPKYDRINMKNQLTIGEEKTKELIESGANYVVRLKVPDNFDVLFKDIIRGEVTVNSKEIDDQVLMKSDGFPTYHLANVVDDYLMGITHVIRGEEWLPSTPKHVLLYDAFGWQKPQFAHLPLLLNKDKSKLSKRQGDVAVEDYIAKGYIKEAFVNFIALLGWNPTGDREIYEFQELIDMFNLEKVNKGGAVFDLVKLDWMNAQYLRKMPQADFVADLRQIIESKGYSGFSDEYLAKIIILFRERVNLLKEIPEIADYFFEIPERYDEDYKQKHWKETTIGLVEPMVELYENADDFSHGYLHDLTMKYVESAGIKLKEVIHPLRLMMTGKSSGAGMFETMELLGKEKCVGRMKKFLEKI